jgi:hypothetical protein
VIFKVLNPKVHGIIDYAMAGTLIAAPYLFGFNKKDRLATTLSITNGISILGLSLLTRYPLGAIKLLSFPVHGVIETSTASLLTLAPYLFDYRSKRASTFHTIAGLATLGVVALTNYRATIKRADKIKTTETESVAA